jgi:hypothetical protein
MGTDNNNPTDDWNDWGATENVTPQNNDFDGSDWDNFNNSNNSDNWGSQQQTNSDWNDFDNQQQAGSDWDNFQSQQQQSSSSDWDNFQSQQSSGDNWGSSQNQQSSGDNWNNFQNQQPTNGGFIDASSDTTEEWNNFQNQQGYENASPVQESQPVQTNLSTKKIAFILAGGLILIALLFMFIDKIHITKKDTTATQTTTTTQTATSTEASSNTTQSQSTTTNVASGSVTLVEIPSSTSMSYSSDVLDANGVVSAKTKYVQGHQILYCITINVTFGSSSESINYYCNYSSYNAVSVGDVVVVTYQQVEDNYISVSAISK